MREFEIKTIETTELTKIICNKCGKEVLVNDCNYIERNLIHSFNTAFSYGSDYDMSNISFDLCEYCLLEILSTFKTNPIDSL